MFKDNNYEFKWSDLGNIELGRPNLGDITSVASYRLMHYTLRAVLIKNFGSDKANVLLYEAGKLAGFEFCKNLLNTKLETNAFIKELYEVLLEMKIGVLRLEESDYENKSFVVTLSEDLDCSGLPITNNTVCDYDEGFFAGIMGCYYKKEFFVKEIDCWSTGARTCRFQIKPD